MIEKDVKVKVYAESKTHGFDLHKEMSFDDYCREKGYFICEWHKIEEKLPESDKQVLLELKFEDGSLHYIDGWYDEFNKHFKNTVGWIENVIAWMDVPKHNEE